MFYTFESSIFKSVSRPINITSSISDRTSLIINSCSFILCSNTAIYYTIQTGTATLNTIVIAECFSEKTANGINIIITKESLASANLISVCCCISEESISYGNHISCESLIYNANFTHNTAKWESAIKLYGSDCFICSMLYSTITRCKSLGDTIFSLYGSSSILRSCSVEVPLDSPTTISRIENVIIENCNLNANSTANFFGNGIITNTFMSSNIHFLGNFSFVGNMLTKETKLFLESVNLIKGKTKENNPLHFKLIICSAFSFYLNICNT